MSYLDWHVGMKVVCVSTPERIAAFQAKAPGSVYPEANGVYTIREIRDDGPKVGIAVLVEEIDNSHLIGFGFEGGRFCYREPGFNPAGFRPVQTRSTSIEVFTAMLTKTPVDA